MPVSQHLRSQNPAVVDVASSQKYYVSREIKLKELGTGGHSTYTEDYPEKPLPAKVPKEPATLADLGGSIGTTTYGDHFAKPDGHKVKSAKPGAKVGGDVPLNAVTTQQADYVKWPIPEKAEAPEQKLPEDLPFTHNSTYKTDYLGDDGHRDPSFKPPGAVYPGVKLAEETTNRADYTNKRNSKRDPINPPDKLPPVRAFDGLTEMKSKYVGHKLGLQRVSLGVELVNDVMYRLIERTAPLPTEGKVIVTTVHDNETTVCILVWGGEDRQASKNTLLAQFDLTNIPPQPHDVPSIEVTFKLDEHNTLNVEARDLDTDRHAEWLANGGEIVYREAKEKAPQKLKVGGPKTRK